MERELERIFVRLDAIDTKLGNHIVHISADISAINTDIGWLKRFSGEKKAGGYGAESKDDIKTQQDVDWLKRFFWIGVTAALGSIASLGVTVFHIVFKIGT